MAVSIINTNPYCEQGYELLDNKCYKECTNLIICADNKLHCCMKNNQNVDLGERSIDTMKCPSHSFLNENKNICEVSCPDKFYKDGDLCMPFIEGLKTKPVANKPTLYDNINDIIKKNTIIFIIGSCLMCICCISIIIIIIK